MGGILGGSKSSSSSKQGYSALPKELQNAFNKLGLGIEQYTNPANPGVTQAFTPTPLSSAEQGAISNINQGFAPTAQSLQSDLSMLQNPFDSSVIDEINRQGQGQYSVLQQALNGAGQLGSNRSLLGANDIDLSRMQQIGTFKQDQYNQALGQIFNNLIPTRQQDAQAQLTAGQLQRGLAQQTALAPVTALGAGTGMLGPFVQGGTSTQTSSQSGGIGGLFGTSGLFGTAGIPGLLQAIPGMAASDIRLKENIDFIGQENGHRIYEFSYKNNPRRFIGVMAHEVPEATIDVNGYKFVDYNKIGVKFREVLNG